MDRPPSHQDAELILRLYELRREPRMRQARDWFATSFNAETREELDLLCAQGSEENTSFRMVVGYWDMAASFIVNGILHRELFFESGWEMLLCWEKIHRLVPVLREQSKNRTLFRNLQEVGEAYVDWLNARSPDFYEAYSQAVGALGMEEAAGEEV